MLFVWRWRSSPRFMHARQAFPQLQLNHILNPVLPSLIAANYPCLRSLVFLHQLPLIYDSGLSELDLKLLLTRIFMVPEFISKEC